MTKIAKSAKGVNLVHDPESAFEEIGPQTPRTAEAISSRNIELASGVLPGANWKHSMVASVFEYRHRFWMIVLVYLAAYAFYNRNQLNILYAVVPWNGHMDCSRVTLPGSNASIQALQSRT